MLSGHTPSSAFENHEEKSYGTGWEQGVKNLFWRGINVEEKGSRRLSEWCKTKRALRDRLMAS
jgi:hypothetical protein